MRDLQMNTTSLRVARLPLGLTWFSSCVESRGVSLRLHRPPVVYPVKSTRAPGRYSACWPALGHRIFLQGTSPDGLCATTRGGGLRYDCEAACATARQHATSSWCADPPGCPFAP